MVFRAADNPARWEGVAVCLWLAVANLLLVRWIVQRPTDWLRFALLFVLLVGFVTLLYVGYRTWVAFSLEYWLDRNALTVRCADTRHTIPLSSLRQMVIGLEEERPTAWREWPAPYVQQPVADEGVTLLASRPLPDCIVLDAAERAYAVSPAAADEFIEAVQERVRMGPVATATPATERTLDPGRLLHFGRTGVVLIALGLLGAVLVFGALMVRYPGLPDVLAVRYSAQGIPEQVREKQTLFILPAIGLLSWLVNGVWGMVLAARGQKPGAYLLWGGTLVVQVCALFALLALIGWR